MNRSRHSRKPIVLAACVLVAAGAAGWWWQTRPPRSLDDLPRELQEEFLAHHEKAREQLRLRQWEDAEAELERCLGIFDGEAEVFTDLGQVYLGMRIQADPNRTTEDEEDALLDRAFSALDHAIELHGGCVSARKARWRTWSNPTLRRYEPDRALDEGEEILRLTPEDDEFRRMHARWLSGGVRFSRVGKRGVAFESSIGTDLAERHIGWLLDRAPVGSDSYAQAMHGLGQVYFLMGDFERALECFKSLDDYSLSPEIKSRILIDLGYAHYRLGRYGEAAGCFIRALDIKRGLVPAWLLHLTYRKLGRDSNDLSRKYRFPLPPEEVDLESPPKIRFTEMGEALGVAKVDGAGPSAFADYDNDGDPDILAAGCDTFTALYRNDGDHFEDVTIEAGLYELDSGFSTNLVDYDNDGHLDIYISRNGWNGRAPNVLLRNMGDGTFVDRSEASGLDDGGSGFVTIWSDFDRDGYLDVFIANGVLNEGSTNRLYRNLGDGTFEDVTERTGLAESRRWGTIGVAVGDYDRDGDPDIFLNGRQYAPSPFARNPGDSPNRLYRNRGDGTFEEVAEAAGVTAPMHDGYVAFFLDYNNDAYPDLLTTSLARWTYVLKGLSRMVEPGGPDQIQSDAPRLYRNDRDGTFTDVTYQARIGYPLGVMGANVADVDNDGYIDLYFGTGNPEPTRLEPTIFYRNNGDGTFSDLSRFAGLDHLGKGHGFTFADFDQDGDLDIYAPQGGFCHGDLWANPFYRNEAGNENHWFHLKLRGRSSNRFAVGAQVTVRYGDALQYREVQGSVGFGSTDSYPVEFGLGISSRIDSVEIRWPSGEKQTLKSPPVDALIEVVESEEGWKVIHRGGKKK